MTNRRMTNKEAIAILKSGLSKVDFEKYYEAFDMAIKALERDGLLDYDECGTTCLSCPVCGAVWKRK